MLRTISRSAMAVALSAGLVASSVGSAEAHGRGAGLAVGVAAGLIGLGILGAAANASPRYRDSCYRGAERCGWRDRRCFVNAYGDEVCRGGRYTCWRPTYCD